MWTRSTKKIVISFDWHHDRNYRYLLSAFDANRSSQIAFEDLTPGEINSNNVARVKAVLTRQISESSHMLVIVGAYANSRHPDAALIGDINWQCWEINKAKELGKPLLAIRLANANESPKPLLNAGAQWAYSFSVDNILKLTIG